MRICTRDEGFDDDRAIKLPIDDQEQLELDMVCDQTRMLEALRARAASAEGVCTAVETGSLQAAPSTHARAVSPSSACDGETSRGVLGCLREHQSGYVDHSDTGSEHCGSFVSSYVPSPADSFEAILDMFAGNPEDNGELVPLVHLWLDLEATLKEEDIPDPSGLFEERDAIVR